ncbi:MAG: recombination mediator RecR [Gammaproteobacteria bacterium]|nr:recombination mediator RecR [Gammaproteobacteria bacterium]MDH3449029.1 recombination mediator RecR [Gammaproteobacteria bacterium]
MSSTSLNEMIESLKCLPGVGQKSAQRMALHLLERDQQGARRIADAIDNALQKVRHCDRCRNFSDSELCTTCDDASREQNVICVVETPADVLAVESSGAYRGRYFVLLGRLSPLDGYGPEQLGLDELERQLGSGIVKEVILATSATVEGDITAQYIADFAVRHGVVSSRLARGIPLGGELEFVDGGTLSRALSGRQQLG